MKKHDIDGGGLRAAIPFREVWFLDFEFQVNGGERPQPVAMVAKEWFTGQTVRCWRDELLELRAAPFGIGEQALTVSFYASAEVGCMLQLGWGTPRNLLDLFAEHRCETNGLRLPHGNGLLGALAWRGLVHMDASEKEAARRLITHQASWSELDRSNILSYCESDVEALRALFESVADTVDWPRALLRGRYMASVAHMERTGIPVDARMYRLFKHEQDKIKRRLVNVLDRDYQVYEGLTFKADRFSRYLASRGIPWPRLESRRLDLKDDTFKSQASLWPELTPLRELRQTLSALKLSDLQIGTDGCSRTLLSPFASVTGRNQPSASKFPFGPAKWLRGVMRPVRGWGFAEIDFVAQENGLAAAFAKDELMIQGYLEGDPYLAFAKEAGLAPRDATKVSHKAIRDRCKVVVLGANYGMGPETMAAKMGSTIAEARELMARHRNTYRAYWDWTGRVVDTALLTGQMQTVFGWKRRVTDRDKSTSLMNWSMQANGAEMMRLAAIMAIESGITVCAPVHDAFLITAPLNELEDATEHMRGLMSKAGEIVTGGISIRTEAKLVRYPDRYMDERGLDMWNRIVDLIHVPEERVSRTV